MFVFYRGKKLMIHTHTLSGAFLQRHPYRI